MQTYTAAATNYPSHHPYATPLHSGYVVGWLEVDFEEELDLNNLAEWAEPRE